MDVRVNAVPTNSSIFNALVTWKNSEPQDYPLLASYVQWGIGKSYEPTSVIGISRVNGVSDKFMVMWYTKNVKLDCQMDRQTDRQTAYQTNCDSAHADFSI